jgi:hypothetical protein
LLLEKTAGQILHISNVATFEWDFVALLLDHFTSVFAFTCNMSAASAPLVDNMQMKNFLGNTLLTLHQHHRIRWNGSRPAQPCGTKHTWFAHHIIFSRVVTTSQHEKWAEEAKKNSSDFFQSCAAQQDTSHAQQNKQ